MHPEDFIKQYENALATQDWSAVAPLMDEAVCVTFSDGSVHEGKLQVQKAFQNNFDKIKSEEYAVENVRWVKKEDSYAVYLFDYKWAGIVNGQSMSGSGIGTSVIAKDGERWKLVTEHLGRKAQK